jgi:alkylated DNA repair protein (DNA oxidative demethylase)
MNTSLFEMESSAPLSKNILGPDTAFLAGFAFSAEEELLSSLNGIIERPPFRNMITPGGFRMSVAMSNCGALGWITDRTSYRYDRIDPETNCPWPGMPTAFQKLAVTAAEEAGFLNFVPDACLINRYGPGARLSLHQDKNERDFTRPIVSVSLGLPATFLFGGSDRADKTRRIQVVHGDVLVWGGSARLRYHGIAPLRDGEHPRLGRVRYNLTFRVAGL